MGGWRGVGEVGVGEELSQTFPHKMGFFSLFHDFTHFTITLYNINKREMRENAKIGDFSKKTSK